MEIISPYDRDRLLHDLYSNKELLVFTHGAVWFEEKLTEVWMAYYEFVKMPEKWRSVGIDKSKWEYYNL